METHFTARDIQTLQGVPHRVERPLPGVPAGSIGRPLEGRKTPSGWLVVVEWESGPARGEKDCLTRGEVQKHLVRC